MIDLLPEQTAYAEFTLTETPDSLPTVAAYKASADGVFGAESGMSSTVVNVSGLSYYASAIIPEDASPGDRFSLLVTVTVGGTASVFWLALGQVAGNALTPEQATWIEETHAKAMLIGDYPQILVDRDPAIGERFKLHKGADYKADLNNALRIVDVGGTVFPAATTAVKIEIGHRVNANEHATIEGVIEADGSDLVAVFDVLASDTAGITPGPCDYMLYELVNDQWRRLDVTGQCHVDRGIRGA